MACGDGQPMGISWNTNACWRRKNRWLLRIDDICDDGTDVLPPQKSARPSLTFKEVETQHLNETIYFPTKPDWKPISLVLYDIKGENNPVFDWIKIVYNVSPTDATWGPSCGNRFKREAILTLYDGCGGTIETWHFQNAWPQVAEFGELEMRSSDVVVCEVTLRYDRAYLNVTGQGGGPGGGGAGGGGNGNGNPFRSTPTPNPPGFGNGGGGGGGGGGAPGGGGGGGGGGAPGGGGGGGGGPFSNTPNFPGGGGGLGAINPSGGGLPGGFGVGSGSITVGGNNNSGFNGTGQVSSGPFSGPLNTFVNIGGVIMQVINGAFVPVNTSPGYNIPTFRPGSALPPPFITPGVLPPQFRPGAPIPPPAPRP